jgi:hypothetical protein
MLLPPMCEWNFAVFYWDQNFFRANKIKVVYSTGPFVDENYAVLVLKLTKKILPAVHCADSGSYFQSIGQFLKYSVN